MLVTIVRFPASETSSEPDPAFGANAVAYLEVPGLLWKAYLRGEDGSVGGVYWWADRASAEARLNDGWRAGVTEKYGAEPVVEWFEAPVVADARFQAVRVEAPPPRVVIDPVS